MEQERRDRLVVHTCIYGPGHSLPPVAEAPDVDYVCFTDRTDLDPGGWRLVPVVPLLADDLPRSSREQKIRPHRWLPLHGRSLYVDPTVVLRAHPEEAWQLLAGDDDVWFGAMLHSYHATLADELDAVRANDFDAAERIEEHVRMLVRAEPGALDARPVWGGMLARRHHDPRCVAAMEDWWAQVLRYSRRDQLSLPSVLRRHGPEGVRLVEHDNKSSDVHTWPVRPHGRPRDYRQSVRESLLPAEELAALEAARRRELESTTAELTAALREEKARRKKAESQRDAARRRVEAVLASRSWRWTRPLRGLRSRDSG